METVADSLVMASVETDGGLSSYSYSHLADLVLEEMVGEEETLDLMVQPHKEH
jgi:hypothetical protein